MPDLNGKPTNEEMEKAIDDLTDRVRDKQYNGEDKQKDREKGIAKEDLVKEEAFVQFKDNYKELMNFLSEYNIKSIYDFKLVSNKAWYPFGSYFIYGNSKEDNQNLILEKNKKFLDAFKITKLHMHDLENFLWLGHWKLTARALRIRDQYMTIEESRYFIPECLIGLPKEKLNKFFFLFLVNNDLCDGLLDQDQIDPAIHHKLHWEYYPVIYIDRVRGKFIQDKIKATIKFFDENKDYIVY
jgi:hypothetical protein